MSKRFSFGPQIVGTWPRPVVEGEKPDVSVSASIKGVRPSAPGTIELDVAFGIPAYDPSQFSPLVEVYAIHYGPGHGIPLDAGVAVKSDRPKAVQSTAGLVAGGEVIATIVGAQSGQGTVVTVLAFDDPAATPAS